MNFHGFVAKYAYPSMSMISSLEVSNFTNSHGLFYLLYLCKLQILNYSQEIENLAHFAVLVI